MNYRVLLESGAERDLQAIAESLRDSIIQRILSLRDNPHPPGCKKLSGTAHNWRIRSGDYRILYAIEKRRKEVLVFRIKHRREAYR